MALLDRAIDYASVQVPNDELIVPHHVIVTNLTSIRDWVADVPRVGPAMVWGTLAARATAAVDAETAEQFHALLIECYPEFADAAADYLPIGAARVRDVQPEMSVAVLRRLLHDGYGWALRMDLGNSEARRHFWYHSADNGGEQRRGGDRGVDPHEEFESFIDHVGMTQRLAALLTAYDDDAPVAEIIADQPDIAYAISRVQYLAGLPRYSEIRGNLGSADFLPSQLDPLLPGLAWAWNAATHRASATCVGCSSRACVCRTRSPPYVRRTTGRCPSSRQCRQPGRRIRDIAA